MSRDSRFVVLPECGFTMFVKHRNIFDFFAKISFRTLTFVIPLFHLLPKIHDHIGENGDKYRLKYRES